MIRELAMQEAMEVVGGTQYLDDGSNGGGGGNTFNSSAAQAGVGDVLAGSIAGWVIGKVLDYVTNPDNYATPPKDLASAVNDYSLHGRSCYSPDPSGGYIPPNVLRVNC